MCYFDHLACLVLQHQNGFWIMYVMNALLRHFKVFSLLNWKGQLTGDVSNLLEGENETVNSLAIRPSH